MEPRAISGEGLGPALGMYSHGMIAPAGEIVVVAGQVGANSGGELVGPADVVAQAKQAFANIDAVLQAAGCTMRDVVRFQTFLTLASDIDGFMRARREIFPTYFPDGVYPPNTLLVISRLVQPELLVEIEAMAVKPARAATSSAKTPSRRSSRPTRRPARSSKRR